MDRLFENVIVSGRFGTLLELYLCRRLFVRLLPPHEIDSQIPRDTAYPRAETLAFSQGGDLDETLQKSFLSDILGIMNIAHDAKGHGEDIPGVTAHQGGISPLITSPTAGNQLFLSKNVQSKFRPSVLYY